MVKNILISVLVVLLIGFLAIRIYLHHELPQYEGELALSGLQDTVEVYTDRYGVPHIFARNESDLFYTAGYIAARERLFQISTIAAATRGELSRLFGERMLADDIYLRTWRIPAMAQRLAAAMDPDTKALVERFCAGINARIDELGNDLPVEFKLLRARPVRWTPADVAGYSRLMAHDLQQSWKPEILFGAVQEYFGDRKLRELLPPDESGRPTIVTAAGSGMYGHLFSTLWEREQALRALTGMAGAAIGSNNWVIAGDRTATGKPLLANDPHLGFTQPAKWYEMHLKGGRFNVSGVCLAGIPVPVIGQNAACAWGFTNVMADDIDFFVEQVNPDNPNQYRSGDQWRDMGIVTERIPLPDGRDTVVTVRLTHHGPIISDLHPLLRDGDRVVSMSWTGHQVSDELTALLRLSLMGNWEDFSEAARMFTVPGQNMVYADTAGNIGWRPAVHIPLRKEGASLTPRPGHDPSYDWQGFIPFEEMPYLFNPPRGMIITANNKTVGEEYPYYISNLWADPSRAQRIHERLEELRAVTVQDVKALQTDLVSPYSRELLPYLIAAATGEENPRLQRALELLRDWDGAETAESAAALVFHATLKRLIYNVYKDELDLIGDGFFAAYVQFPMIPHRNLLWAVASGASSWFDDVTTPDYVETRDDILRRSLQEALEELEQTVGRNPTGWAWGKVHTVTHRHSLGSVKLLDWLFHFNVGPFPAGGSSNTVNNGEYEITGSFEQVVGPSMRRIVDFSDLNRTQFILPTGQSGLPNSPHYRDQAPLYNRGEYRTTYFDERYIRSSDEFRRLVLTPGA
jgi:penicillin amidase